MTGIIKTRKQTSFTTLHNDPLQNLTDLKTIGLISYLMSLPEDWKIYKTELFNRFGRGPVNTAFNELQENRYLFTIKCRIGKKDDYRYYVSDEKFTDDYIIQEILSCDKQILDVIAHDFNYEICDVDFRQSKMDNPICTIQNNHLQKKYSKNKTETKKKDINETLKHNSVGSESVPPITNNIDNDLQALIVEYTDKGITESLMMEIFNKAKNDRRIKNVYGYLRNSCEKIIKNRKDKTSNIQKQDIEKNLPSWIKNNGHKKITDTELKNLEKEYYEKKKKEINAKLGV